MAQQERNSPAQQGTRDDMDDERMKGTDDVRGVADEGDEEFEDTEDSEEDEEDQDDEGTF